MGAAQGISVLSDVVDALDFWQDNTPVEIGDIARSSKDSMIYAVATKAGTTGTIEPVWGTTAGVTINDNDVTWLVKDIRTADKAIQADKLSAAHKINGVAFDGTKDIILPSDTMDDKSYIANGLKVAGFSNKTLSISSGAAKIAGQNVTYTGGNIDLDARKASLVYLDNNAALGKVNAAYPIDKIDDNTVGFWAFDQQTAGAVIPNLAVGKSAIAVTNDLIPHGGITAVDGLCDTALQLDGTTGYFTGSNLTGFPSGAAEREASVLFTVNSILSGTVQTILAYGTGATGQYFLIYMNASGFLYISSYGSGADYSTSLVLEVGKSYTVTVKYNGAYAQVFINGVKIYQTALAFNTNNSYFSVGGYSGGTSLSAITLHYLEIRNKMRTDAETAQIANKMMMPAYYYKSSAAYPTIPAADQPNYHEYKFDESTVGSVADSAGTNSGTATGVTIEKSKTIGNCLRFAGAATSYVDIGMLNIGPEMTFIAVLNPDNSTGPLNRIFGIKSPTTGFMIALTQDGSAGLSIHNGSAWTVTNMHLMAGIDNFVAIKIHAGNVYFRVGKQTTVMPITITPATINMCIGGNIYNTQATSYKGTISYLGFINRALENSEIDAMYNTLTNTGRMGFLDDIVPANATALAVVKTGTDKIVEYNDSDYKYGRREGATGGNRKVFLGWQWFSGTMSLKWENPFGTQKLRLTLNYAQDSNGLNEVPCIPMFYNGSQYLGIFPNADANGYNDSQDITAYTAANGVSLLHNAWKSSGYIGCYAEVLEDYKGV